jgi:hypothetical protein
MQAVWLMTRDAGRRVLGFLKEEAAAIGNAVSATLQTALGDAVTQLGQAELEQGSVDRNAQGVTSTEGDLRQNVIDRFIGPIGVAAKIALAGTPEFPNLTAPAIARRKKAFVARATEVADAAEKHADILIANGMSPDFIAQFRAAIAEIDDSRATRGNLVTQRSKATGGLGAADKKVRNCIRLIDWHLKPIVKRDEALAKRWASAKLIHQVPVNPLPTGTAANAATEPATTPTPAAPALVTEAEQTKAA